MRFKSTKTGKVNSALSFEVLGLPQRETQLLCVGTCEVPQVNDDPRNVFMNRIKTRPVEARRCRSASW